MGRKIRSSHSRSSDILNMNLDIKLNNLRVENKPILVGLAGAGYAASGFANQLLTNTPGMKLVAISNRTISKADLIYKKVNITASHVSNKTQLDQVIKEHGHAITDNADLLCESNLIDVIVDATGDVEFGAHLALKAIENNKHIVLVNAELDSTIGPILKHYADKKGVIYTQTDGDQPGVIMNLYRYVKLLGLTPIVAGNIKSVLDHFRTPETQKKWAIENNQSPLLATTAVDGTKIAMEMATVANATGLKTGTRGMYGPQASHVNESITKFNLDRLLKNGGIVDYILGAEPSFGVFVIAYTDNPERQKYLKMYKTGDGPYYVFHRPFHLCTLETHISIAEAVINNNATLAPLAGPVCDVITIAKKDLKKGEKLDGIGGFTAYGMLENYETSIKENLLPMGLSKDCVLIKDVKKNEAITYKDIVLPVDRLSDKLRNDQAKLFS